MAHSFALTSVWLLECPVPCVWRALHEVEAWPSWWPYVAAVNVLDDGDALGCGARQRFTWTSALPYRLTFTMQVIEVDLHARIVAIASGDLAGRGVWSLQPTPEGTRVQYDWSVAVTRPWMMRLAPLLAPLYRWNHAQVMAAGERGLARHLMVASLVPRSVSRSVPRSEQRAAHR